ncbi:3-beta hydroxysteroid dehydrogenase [Microbacterium mangrovi]|uniref:3-beta hydroxysteroid dehydrogenase n=1 Tax=Microbacterium mangrovi TaxID=1348253 RepID=A0A0B2A5E2_9MICO|nr:SDR family oxidoreductase [Microbacterium mangrovi]KHK98290.1 3-beta hydroxysteroid dehydrogenase [Microbacterium mangrovi]
MHVFITGGTGLIGSVVVAELLRSGHTVTGLARSDRSAAALEAAGADVLRGALGDVTTVRGGAERADGAVHLAFGNDFSSPEALARDIADESAAVAAIGDALVGTGKPFVSVSGTPAIPGRASLETDPLPTVGPVAGRSVTLTSMLGLADRGVRTSAVRLPRTVHADGAGGFAGLLTRFARESGVSGYPGDGTQRWPAVHARDAAVLFRLALESAPAGSSWHAVADEGDAVRDIAAVIGRRLQVPVQAVPPETYGTLGPIFAADQPSSSAYTRATLGWNPTHPSLLEDLELIRP